MTNDEMGPDPATLAQGWFAVGEDSPGIFVIEEPLHVEEVKSYLIVGDERAMLLDTGTGVGDMRTLVDGLTDRSVFVVNSHAHWDHIGGNHWFDEIWIHEAEADGLLEGVSNERLQRWFTPKHLRGPLPATFNIKTFEIPPTPATGILQGGEFFNLGGRTLEVIHCPGHSPGGIVLLDADDGVLFSTDVAYADALYAYSDEADLGAYRASLERLATLTPVLRSVYPCHGPSPIAPAMLPAMRDAIVAILGGRPPDGKRSETVAEHEFDGFSVLVPAEGGDR